MSSLSEWGTDAMNRSMSERGPLWLVMPCMGRLEFVRQTLPIILSDPEARLCLVDYSCPDRCGEWLRREFPEACAAGRAVVEEVSGRTLFNKSKAHNAGARRAGAAGAGYLCLVDADTVLRPGFLKWLGEQLRPGCFWIAARRADGTDAPGLTGLLAVEAEAFVASGGLDETFQGWGAEDIEFRVRLRLLHGLDHADIPLELVEALPHGDDLRTRFYRQKSCGTSNHLNYRRLRHRIRGWRERWKVDPTSLDRLWYRGWAG